MDRAFGRTNRGGHFSFGFLGAAAALSLLLVPGLRGQLVTNVAAVPDNGKPPVIFLNGYQFGCTDRGTFAGTFGIADQVLAQDVRAVLFFNNCEVAPNVSIEELGNAFGRFLGSLKYADGRSVPQVDVVAHSMGGMIVRSYLAGKQPQRGSFTPPADTRIRKVIFLAVPFFGAVAVEVTGAPDIQSSALQIGSAFVFDLGTWNQNNDDLRGVDAIGVVATGGSGLSSGVPRFDDSTVSVTSGSLEWYLPGRTRIATGVCHTILTGFFTVGCTNPAVSVAQITSDQHDSAKIIRSFLNGTSEWQSVGQSPAGNDFLKDRGGVALQFRDRTDQIISIDSASATGAGMLKIRNREIAWNENVPGQPPLRISATSGSTTITADIPVASGQTKAFIVTTGGPGVGAVIPNFADVFPRAVAPGSFISIYGSSLATSTATAGGLPYPVSLGGAEVRMNDQPIALQYVSDQQINAVVPDSLTGLVKLQVRTANG
ncbi:MAG: hypothetical protein H7Y20_03070, partial [Bryobacteraceae bacterium]|nr:hypothetical protein [Bryobacteraceae bacterium]